MTNLQVKNQNYWDTVFNHRYLTALTGEGCPCAAAVKKQSKEAVGCFLHKLIPVKEKYVLGRD